MNLRQFLQLAEYWGGQRAEPPPGAPRWTGTVALRCILWAGALVVIYFFSGQSSKFIYIDF